MPEYEAPSGSEVSARREQFLSKAEERRAHIRQFLVGQLKNQGMTIAGIAKKMGIPESSVRNLLKE